MPQPSSRNPIGYPFIDLRSVDSTNNYALAQIHAGLAQHGMAIFAREQTAGKGQWGKTWTADKDSNIILSIVVNPSALQLAQQFQLSACAAVAVHDFFTKYAGEESKIKWPNDIYWQDRKAGGILIENIVGETDRSATDFNRLMEGYTPLSKWKWAIIGTGININQASFPASLKNPVSLKQITGKNFDTVTLAKELCRCMDKKFQQLITEGFDGIYTQYLSNLYKKNEQVKLKKENRVFEAIIKTVLPTGELVVTHTIEETYATGEVEFIFK